jgi:hypothetical protein
MLLLVLVPAAGSAAATQQTTTTSTSTTLAAPIFPRFKQCDATWGLDHMGQVRGALLACLLARDVCTIDSSKLTQQ